MCERRGEQYKGVSWAIMNNDLAVCIINEGACKSRKPEMKIEI